MVVLMRWRKENDDYEYDDGDDNGDSGGDGGQRYRGVATELLKWFAAYLDLLSKHLHTGW